MVERVILVIAAEVGTRPSVARAVEQVNGVGARVLGVVLNKVNLERNSYYYSQNYGEYYRSYYSDEKPKSRGGDRPSSRPPVRPGGGPARRA
jgi:Mrp family chromosome partitioning ATPase